MYMIINMHMNTSQTHYTLLLWDGKPPYAELNGDHPGIQEIDNQEKARSESRVQPV
jgi:hypothetical protein